VFEFELVLHTTPGCMRSAGAFLPVTKFSGQTRLAGKNETLNMIWSPGCRIQHVNAWPYFSILRHHFHSIKNLYFQGNMQFFIRVGELFETTFKWWCLSQNLTSFMLLQIQFFCNLVSLDSHKVIQSYQSRVGQKPVCRDLLSLTHFVWSWTLITGTELARH
jgi:hypothetical protein